MNRQTDSASSSNRETKFSFFKENVFSIPKNLPKQNTDDMEMRKSQIKFGGSFGSSFFKSKEDFNK